MSAGRDGALPHGLPALPEGFRLLRRGSTCAVVDASLAEALRSAGLLDPARVRARLAAAGRGRGGRGGRAPISEVSLPGGPTVALRGLRRGGWLGPWLGAALLDPARPFRELAATARLRAAGAPVPRPLLALAWRRGLVWNAAVATSLLPDTVDGATFLAQAPPVLRRRALRAAGRAIRRFHDAGGRHADLHVGNLLVDAAAGDEPVWIVDLDRCRTGAPPDAAARMAELARLYRSLRKRSLLAPTGGRRGCATFLAAYAGGDRDLRRALLARWPVERRRLALRALRYRTAR